MFRDIVTPSIRVGSKKGYVLPLSIVIHVGVLAFAFLVPLMAPGVLPTPATRLMAFVSRDVVLPPEPPPAPRPPVANASRVPDADPGVAPLEAPSAFTPEPFVEVAAPPVGTVAGVGNLAGVFTAAAVRPPPPLPPSTPDDPIRIGGELRPPTKIKDVRPVYPAIAQAARVEGVVIIETTIGTTGQVLNATLLGSVPLLDEAALAAVRQWEFTPTLLNGNPVAVVMTVTVRFTLQ
jgi:protein TonB